MKRVFLCAILASLFPGTAFSAEEYRGHVENLVVAPGQVFNEVHCLGCFVRIEGRIEDDLISILGGVEVQGEVSGDVIVVGGGLRLGPRAVLKGDAIVIGGPVERHPSAQVAGEVITRWWAYLPGQRQVFLPGASVFLGLTVGLALFGYVVLRARRTQAIIVAFRARPFSSLLLGLILVALGLYALSVTEMLGNYEDTAVYLILMLGFLLGLPGFAALSLWLGQAGKQVGVAAVLAGGVMWGLLMIVPLLGLLVFCLLYALCVGSSVFGRCGFGRRPSAGSLAPS